MSQQHQDESAPDIVAEAASFGAMFLPVRQAGSLPHGVLKATHG
jgi:hypothetical protein